MKRLLLLALVGAVLLNAAPALSDGDFYVIPVTSMTFKGDWDVGKVYNAKDVVFFNGSSWFSLLGSNQGHAPDVSPTQWTLLAKKGDTGPTGASPWGLNGVKTYYTQGNVGIGTTDPTYPLTIDTGQLMGLYAINHFAGGQGIQGYSAATSGNGIGVAGVTSSSTGYGVYGQNSHGGWAGYFSGNLGASGTKPAIVPTSQGHRLLYSQESPEVWFEDFGEGRLVGGKAHIKLDPLFLETVTIDDRNPQKVFIQLNDDCKGVYVQRQATGFEVKELQAGTSNASFTYRVVAKRKGYETARLEAAPDTTKVAALNEPLKVAKK
jgi:hypothetical protein